MDGDGTMKLGLSIGYSRAALDIPVKLVQRAEELGYDSVWAGEHVVLPNPRVAPAPMDPTDPILDPLVHLAFVAAATDHVLLGTGRCRPTRPSTSQNGAAPRCPQPGARSRRR